MRALQLLALTSILALVACTPQQTAEETGPVDTRPQPFRADNGKWGFKNTGGKVIIEPKFENVNPFFDGMARIKEGGLYGFIDESGKVVIEPKFVQSSSFNEGAAAVALEEGEYGFIDKTGKYLFDDRYAHAEGFVDGYAMVKKGDEEGYVTKDGTYKKGPIPGTEVMEQAGRDMQLLESLGQGEKVE